MIISRRLHFDQIRWEARRILFLLAPRCPNFGSEVSISEVKPSGISTDTTVAWSYIKSRVFSTYRNPYWSRIVNVFDKTILLR